MNSLPDHPDIAHTLRYGYPRPDTRLNCEWCGNIAEYHSDEWGLCCESCALACWYELTETERLEKLEFERIENE